MNKKNKHRGSSFDEFLAFEKLTDECSKVINSKIWDWKKGDVIYFMTLMSQEEWERAQWNDEREKAKDTKQILKIMRNVYGIKHVPPNPNQKP